MEQRVNIKILVKLKKTAMEKFNLLRETYRENSLSRALCVWMAQEDFRWRGREDLENDERTGHPITTKTDENLGKVRACVRTDRHLGISMIAEHLNMDKETSRQILTTNLKTKKVFAKMVPKNPPAFSLKRNTNAQTRSVHTRSWTVW